MDNSRCNFCGHIDHTNIYTLKDIRMNLPGEFNLVQCNNCGLLFLDPKPNWSELTKHYPDNYHGYKLPSSSRGLAFANWAQSYGLRRRRKMITDSVKTGKLLDIGCATGLFLNEMMNHGNWDAYGIEPSQFAAEYARNHFGLNVFTGLLHEAAFASSYFDVITLWDVLEHIEDPQGTLYEIYRILKPGGLVLIKTPNPTSWEAKFFKQNWVGFEAPQHLYLFPPGLLINKLSQLGLKPIKTSILGTDYATLVLSLSLRLKDKGYIKLGYSLRTLSRSTLARVISTPILYPFRYVGFTSSLLYMALKPLAHVEER